MNIQEWENRLSAYISQIQLLSEIPISRADHSDLENVLKIFVQEHGLTKATRYLKNKYPATFITYLAFKAAFNEDRGFWEKVARVMGQKSENLLFQPAHHWGQTFMDIIQYYKLPTFSGVSELEYITTIRLHGGIPAYSLPDFFKHILLPSVEENRYSLLEDQLVLMTLLEHYKVKLFVDDIVRNFFQYGGDTAISFFKNCRKMARMAIQGEPLASAEELGLRPYILQTFENYLQNPPEQSLRRKLPRFFFEPYERAFRLLLPSRTIPLERAGDPHFWRICFIRENYDSLKEEVKVRIRRNGQELETEEKDLLLNELTELLQINLVCKNQEEEKIICKRTLRLLPSESSTPLMAFFFENGASCSTTPSLPDKTIWLFYPADTELGFDGEQQLVEELHPFNPPYNNWQAQAWNLKNVQSVHLLREGRDICSPIPVSKEYTPFLKGELIHQQSLPVDGIQLFIGLPKLCLPIHRVQHSYSDLRYWYLTLNSYNIASPSGKWQGKADELPFQYEIEDSCVLLNLSHWLGENPVGTYQLVAQGPSQIKVELLFSVWNEIQIEGLQPYYLPDQQGSSEVSFNIKLPIECKLDALQGDIKIQQSFNDWTIQVCKNADHAKLVLEYPFDTEIVRVPLNLVIPRLHWALQLDFSPVLEWQSTLINISLARLLQSHTPRLRLELPLMEDQSLFMSLILTVPGGSYPLQSSESIQLKTSIKYYEFKLDSFRDTLRRNIEQSIFNFVVELRNTSGKILTTLPVLRITQETNVDVCHFEPVGEGNWRIHWYEPNPLRHRRIRIWSLWQPWSDPIEIPLPDNAPRSDIISSDGWWMAYLPEEVGLPSAHYKVQFLALDPDDVLPLPKEPPKNAIMINDLILPQERLKQLDRELTIYPKYTFPIHAEKACIFDTQNQLHKRNEEIQWCYEHWYEGSLIHLLGFQRWLASRDQSTQKALLLHMFQEESLMKLKAYNKDFIREYLTLIQEIKTIKPASAWMVLNMSKEPQVIYKALQTLIQNKDVQAVKYICQGIESGRFSLLDAAKVMSISPDFSFDQLLQRQNTQTCKKLMIELTDIYPRPDIVVRINYWVKCDAGWGKILHILDGSESSSMFLPDQEKPRLEILLRAGHQSNELIILDLKDEYIIFKGQGTYLCGCGKFMSHAGKENEGVWMTHKQFCSKTDKMIPVPTPYKYHNHPTYSAFPPDNIFS